MNYSRPLIALVMLFAALPLLGQWQGEVRISQTDYDSYPNNNGGWGIAADDENVYLVWSDYNSPDQDLLYYGFPIGNPPESPVPGTVLNHTSFGDHRYASVATSAGKVHVDWLQKWSNGASLDFRENDGSSWGYVITHGNNSLDLNSPVIADDALGNTHCAFSTHNSTDQVGKLFYQRRNAGSSTFEDSILVYDPGYCKRALLPTICMTSDNSIHMAWRQSSIYEVGYAVSSDGINWSVSSIPGTRHDFSHGYPPSISSDQDNNLYVAYRGYDTPYQIAVVKKEGGVWSNPVIVSQNTSDCYAPSICCDALGNVWVAWPEYHSSSKALELAYNRLPAGADFATGWEGPEALTPDDGKNSGDYVDIAADKLGNVHIYWNDSRLANMEIYYNWFQAALPKDAGVLSIDAPEDTVWSGYTCTPKATLANFETDTVTLDVLCVFERAGVVVYSDTVTVTSLAGGDSIQCSFADWTPGLGTYFMTVTALLEGDVNPANDELSKTVISVPAPKDAGVVSIEEPRDTVWSQHSYTPQATVGNFETETVSFDVLCEFKEAGAVVYADTVTVTALAYGATREVAFAEWTSAEADGVEYIVTVSTLLDGDINPSNDVMSKTVTSLWSPRDVAPVAIITPPEFVWSGCPHTPRVGIANFWEEPESFDVTCIIDSAGTVIYSDTVAVTNLEGGDSVQTSFAPWAAGAADEFTYKMSVVTLLAKDLNPANDSLSKSIKAVKAVPDLDIQDYAGNLSANTMELTGVENSIVVGSYVLANPKNEEKNVDIYDGPSNVNLDTLTYLSTDLSTYDGRHTISSSNVDPNLNEVNAILLGQADLNIVQVHIPHKAKQETFTGTVRVQGTGQGASDADEFTLKVTVVDGSKCGPRPSSFSGEPLAQGNQLYWSNFGFGEQGFNLYRAEQGSDEFTKLNDRVMNLTGFTDYDVKAVGEYCYKLGLSMPRGRETLLGPLFLTSSEDVGALILEQSCPNPWIEETEISYFLPKGCTSAALKIYDISGKLVKTLVDGAEASGFHTVTWDGVDQNGLKVVSGIYFYVLAAANQVKTQKMVIVR